MDLVSTTSQEQHHTSPLRLNWRQLLWLVPFLSVLAVSGTILFPDETGRVWRSLTGLVYHPPQAAVRTSRLPARPFDAVASARPRPIEIPPRLIEMPTLESTSQFLRVWQVSGPRICKALRDAGIEMTEWRAASMRSVSYECYFQRIYKRDEVRPLSSSYLRIRGNARGEILDIRAKIVGPKMDAEGRLDPALMRIFETFVEQAGWNDFQDTLDTIRSLHDVEHERFGADFSFTRDAESENSFTFMLALAASAGPQARTRAYFSSDRWVAPPDPAISGEFSPVSLPVQR